MADAQRFYDSLELDIAKLKHKLALLKNAKPVEELTVEDVYEVRPELKKEFHDAISQDNWSTGTSQSDAKEAKQH